MNYIILKIFMYKSTNKEECEDKINKKIFKLL